MGLIRWLQKLGIGSGMGLLSGLAVVAALAVAGLVFIAGGMTFDAGFFLSAVAVALIVGLPLSYLVMILLREFGEIEVDIIRKESQVEYLKKMSSGKDGTEKDQLIRDLNSFAQTVAHDLKTPLTTILGFATMLADNQARIPPAQQKEALQTIVKTSLKMNNIIQELLLLAAVRQATVKSGPIQMGGIVGAARQRLWGVISDSGAQLIVPDAATWPKVIGYAGWVEEVWINYISNAIKYGGSPARIELGADADYKQTEAGRNMARFWVRDNGSGIAKSDQAQLFSQFTRLDQVRAEGHGLGLSIVARVIEKLGGEVGVESEPGEGSLFYFTLPMVMTEPATRARPPVRLLTRKTE